MYRWMGWRAGKFEQHDGHCKYVNGASATYCVIGHASETHSPPGASATSIEHTSAVLPLAVVEHVFVLYFAFTDN